MDQFTMLMLDLICILFSQVVSCDLQDDYPMLSFNRSVVLRVCADGERAVALNLPTRVHSLARTEKFNIAEHEVRAVFKLHTAFHRMGRQPIRITSNGTHQGDSQAYGRDSMMSRR